MANGFSKLYIGNSIKKTSIILTLKPKHYDDHCKIYYRRDFFILIEKEQYTFAKATVNKKSINESINQKTINQQRKT